tara:strand:+ start:49 stop:459 length:411 start_codon:yes stop_codon:yes gene_type:complete
MDAVLHMHGYMGYTSMRMWMINPKLLCDKHLLGEHSELHKHIPSFHKKHKINNRITPVVQIELTSYQSRHDELATEMLHRGMNHKSPLPELPDFSYLPLHQYEAKVDKHISKRDLRERCEDCRRNFETNILQSFME